MEKLIKYVKEGFFDGIWLLKICSSNSFIKNYNKLRRVFIHLFANELMSIKVPNRIIHERWILCGENQSATNLHPEGVGEEQSR
jgi:hypothetical protein